MTISVGDDGGIWTTIKPPGNEFRTLFVQVYGGTENTSGTPIEIRRAGGADGVGGIMIPEGESIQLPACAYVIRSGEAATLVTVRYEWLP